MEGDLLRTLASGLPDEEIKSMGDKLRWGLALYTPAEGADGQPAANAKRVTAGRARRGSPRRSRR